jgi:hypothetical protein
MFTLQTYLRTVFIAELINTNNMMMQRQEKILKHSVYSLLFPRTRIYAHTTMLADTIPSSKLKLTL